MSSAAVNLECLSHQYVPPRVVARAKTKRVRRPKYRRAKRLVLPFVLFALLTLQLWVRLCIIERGYQLEALRKAALENDESLRQRRLEYAYLSRPRTLVQQAREKLGMLEPTPQHIRKLDLGTPQEAR